jgi:hypothetical protein
MSTEKAENKHSGTDPIGPKIAGWALVLMIIYLIIAK